MVAELVEVLVLIVRGALFAGLCWGAWLCVAERIAPPAPAKHLAFERFATFAALVLLLTAAGNLFQSG